MDTTDTTIQVTEIPQRERPRILPKHFGAFMGRAENGIFDQMRNICPAYTGGYWDFFELSNGGFYMAVAPLDEKVHVVINGNGFEGDMSAEAAAIVACLMAFSHLSFRYRGQTDTFAEHFHWLRDFALTHPEQSAIFAAID